MKIIKRILILILFSICININSSHCEQDEPVVLSYGNIYDMELSSDENFLITENTGNYLYIWNLNNGEKIRTNHTFCVQGRSLGLSINRNQKIFASGGGDSSSYIWDLKTGSLLKKLKYHKGEIYDVALHPFRNELASCSNDNTIKILDLSTDSIIKTINNSFSLCPYQLKYTHDGLKIISSNNNEGIYINDASTGELIRILQGAPTNLFPIAISPNDSMVCGGGHEDSPLVLWDLNSGNILNKLNCNFYVRSMDFDAKSQLLAVCGDAIGIKIWNLETDSLMQIIIPEGPLRVRFKNKTKEIVVACYDNKIRFFDIETGNLTRILHNFPSDFFSIDFHPQWDVLAGVNIYGDLVIWDYEDLNNLIVINDSNAISTLVKFHPDGTKIVTGGNDSIIKIWEWDTKKLIKQLLGHKGGVNSLSFDDSGDLLLTGNNDNTISIWSFKNYVEISTFSGNNTSFRNGAKISPDGKRIAYIKNDTNIYILNVNNNKDTIKLIGHRHNIKSINFSPDCLTLGSCSSDCTTRVWDVNSGKQIALLNQYSRDVVFTKNSKYLACADLSINIWDFNQKKVIQSFCGFSYNVNSLALSNNEFQVAGCSEDGTIRIWKLSFTDVDSHFESSKNDNIISPNPSSDYLLLPEEFVSNTEISIYSVLGLQVLQIIPEGNRIDVSGLSPGVYFIRYNDIVQKFIKI